MRWGDCERELPRMADDDRLPLELMAMDRTEEGAAAVLAAADMYRREIPNLENLFNREGYRHLHAGRHAQAIAIFELNVKLFPESWNVHDSLGESYLAAGREAEGLASYRRSLELNSENESAIEALRENR